MAARYKNCLGYDKRDYSCPEKTNAAGIDDEEETSECVEPIHEWDDVSLVIFEFLQDKIEEMAVPLLNRGFGMFDVIQLLSAHAPESEILDNMKKS
jgi:hypothetical protein